MAATGQSPSVTGEQYISALASYIRTHEASLAAHNHPIAPPLAPGSFSNLSWTTLLTLGAISTPSTPLLQQTILKLDPHHLYYLLLKFEEIEIDGIGSLDSQIELPIGVATLTRPLSYAQDDRGGASTTEKRRDSDAASTMSAFSSSLSSLGSNWWTSTAQSTERIDKNRRILDEGTQVKFIYSAFTKLPAITLSPFVFPSTSSLRPSTPLAPLTQPIDGFLDLPPPLISIPLSPFKNLHSLSLIDLSPRSFYGWDLLSFGLRSLEVRNAGIADAGELLWELPSEDFIRRNRQRGEARRNRDRFAFTSEDGTEEDDTPPPLPPHAWHSLTHLSLSNNSLTFIPSAPIATLARLTSIDLSSNLLIAVPAGLASLKFLRSINLSDNMIENLSGISTALPTIRVINLSKNRLENLSGLDRLVTLERIDLRENRIKESGEIGRLAVLPLLREVYVLANPFSLPVVAVGGEGMGEEGWRLKIFNYFIVERKGSPSSSMVKIDGHGPTSSERRALVLPPEWNETFSAGRGSSSLGSMGGSWGRQNGSVRNEEAISRSGVGQKVVGTGARRVVTSPNLFVPTSQPRTIVEESDVGNGNGKVLAVEKEKIKKPKSHKHKPKRIVDLDAPSSSSTTHRTKAPSSTTSSHPNRAGGGSESSSGETTSGTPVGSPPLLFNPNPRHSIISPKTLGSIGRAGSHRSTKESSRISLKANTFDDPSSPSTSSGRQQEGGGISEAFRRKIEALRNEVGDSYLAVLGERELVAEEEVKRRNSKGI